MTAKHKDMAKSTVNLVRVRQDAGYETFEHVCLLVQAGHQQGNDTPKQTLNRLFRKYLAMHKTHLAADPPWLSSANAVVTMESWPKPALRELAPRNESRLPKRKDLPVVIIRYRTEDCLIDGGSRIHAWFKAGDAGSHPACVLTVTIDED